MFQNDNLRNTTSIDIISKKEINSKKKKFFSIIVLTILLAVANVCTYGQKLVRDVGSNGLWGYIEKPSRELKISYKFSEAKQFSEGLAAVQEGLVYKWGFIDKTGKIVIPYKYERVRNFSEGVAVVRLHNKWGAIDTNGTEIVPCIYNTHNEASIAISNPKAVEEFERKLALERERLAAQEREKIALERERLNAQERERLDAQEHEKIALERERIAAQTINPIAHATNAYDIILLRNGNEIKAKVTEITLSEIKYKAFEYLERPTRIVEKKDVFLIIYENGTREVFNTTTETKISHSKRQNSTDCVKNTAFGLDIGIGGGEVKEIFSSTLGIRMMHHFSPYFGIDFFKINWITDVAVYDGLWTMAIQIMPGFRGNSPAFYKCMSVYGAFRLGYGMHIATGYYGTQRKDFNNFKGLCLETELGVNITPAIFVGFSYNYHKCFKASYITPPQHTFFTRVGFNFGK